MNMKRSEFVLGALSVAFVGCTKDGIGEEAKNTKENVEMKKPLVVYFSATGTTKGKAEILARVLGADLREIVPAERYTAADLDWHDKKSAPASSRLAKFWIRCRKITRPWPCLPTC